MAIFGQGQSFGRERGFYRYAQRHLRAAFPSLPTRQQCNRQVRPQPTALVALFLPLVRLLAAQRCASAALDSSGIPTRDAKRRGVGWLPGWADMGGSTRLGWYEGFHRLRALNAVGMLTGFGVGPASPTDHPLAETFFALRRHPPPGLMSVGASAYGPQVVDKGFEGHANHQSWGRAYGAQVLCPPQRHSRAPGPKRLRRWRAGIRQIVETVDDKRWHTFRLDRERPHDLRGFQARLAAKSARHKVCIWLNEQLGRPRLAFGDLAAW